MSVWKGRSRRERSQIDRIEDSAKERMQLNPHSGETHDVALVMMLFEAARLAVENADDPAVATRRRRATGLRPRRQRSCPRRPGAARRSDRRSPSGREVPTSLPWRSFVVG